MVQSSTSPLEGGEIDSLMGTGPCSNKQHYGCSNGYPHNACTVMMPYLKLAFFFTVVIPKARLDSFSFTNCLHWLLLREQL